MSGIRSGFLGVTQPGGRISFPYPYTFLDKQIASGAGSDLSFRASSFDWSKYDAIKFIGVSLVPGSNNVGLGVLMSIDGGATYDVGASSYAVANKVFGVNATSYDNNSGATNYIQLSGATNGISNNGSAGGFNFELTFPSPNARGIAKEVSFLGGYSGATALATFSGAGWGASSALIQNPVNGISFVLKSGVLAYGWIYALGQKNRT
jgi:hypothetical protein